MLILVPLIVEFASDRLEPSRRESQRTWARFFESAFWYQALLKAGSREPHNRFVRIVTFSRGKEPPEVFVNICQQRVLLAKLLMKLETAGPALIVIDKYFHPGACPDLNDPGNRMLATALRASKSPVVLGLRTLDEDDLDAQRPLNGVERQALEKASLVLAPRLDFGSLPPTVKYGILRVDSDTRRIPLQWPVYSDRKELETGQAHLMESLSLVAVEQYDASSFRRPEFNALFSEGLHPFTSFLSEQEIPTLSAIDLVCHTQNHQPSQWQNCEPDDYADDLIRNHIVVVGNRVVEDFHPSVVGTVPSVVLQANYIESLLDGRYLKSLPFYFSFLANFILFLGLGLPCYRGMPWERFTPNQILVASLLFSFILWISVYFIVLHLGYYFVVWFPGALALAALWADDRQHRGKEKERSQTHPRHEG
jgi:hypothetical protein